MRDDLDNCIPAAHKAFRRRGEGDEIHDGVVVVDVTEVTADSVEIAFIDENNVRRYLRLPADRLLMAIHRYERGG